MSRIHQDHRSAAEAVMVSKCANPACVAPFRYLHEGRIFTVDVKAAEHRPGGESNVERYWLCSKCCDSMTLVLQGGKVTLRALATITEESNKPSRPAAQAKRCVA